MYREKDKNTKGHRAIQKKKKIITTDFRLENV